ncbi:MAG TPA: non-canonical purine NTP pyrophosphatase, partial [Solirubrobacterales bacterium]|nr:non-canonical purine NTP pyrophosphatase [Solirubrobacterales bacterium]
GIAAEDLGGAPGIYSARYAGEDASDEVNLDKLLREVDAAGGERRAAYVCAIALIEESGAEYVFEADCEGRLLDERRGSGGFGYDPAFVPDDTGADDTRTYAELSAAEKNAISHRGRAVRKLARHLGLATVGPS